MSSTQQKQSQADNTTVASSQTIFYWTVLVLAVLSVIFFTGALFSCRAFSADRGEGAMLTYGYRGFIHNVTGECTGWEDYYYNSDIWEIRMGALYYMGISAFVVILLAVSLWIFEGKYGMPKQVGSNPDLDAVKNCCCRCYLIPTLVAVALGIFGTLAFVTLMGQCSNIPPLDPGGLGCSFGVWSSFGMFAFITSCLTGCSICCFYRRSNDY